MCAVVRGERVERKQKKQDTTQLLSTGACQNMALHRSFCAIFFRFEARALLLWFLFRPLFFVLSDDVEVTYGILIFIADRNHFFFRCGSKSFAFFFRFKLSNDADDAIHLTF